MRLLPNTKYYFVPLCLRGYIYIKLAHFYRIFVKNFGGRVYKFLSAGEKIFNFFKARKKKLAQIDEKSPPCSPLPREMSLGLSHRGVHLLSASAAFFPLLFMRFRL